MDNDESKRIIELLEDVLRRQTGQDERLDAIEDNTLFLGQQVNNANLRLIEIESILSPNAVSTGFGLNQIQGGSMAAKAKGVLTGVPVGGSGTFQESPLPVGSAGLQTGTVPSYSVDDPLVTLSASPDGDPTKVVASVGAGDTGTSFNMTVSGTNTLGNPISSVFNIAILPAVTPPPVPSTGFDLNQLA